MISDDRFISSVPIFRARSHHLSSGRCKKRRRPCMHRDRFKFTCHTVVHIFLDGCRDVIFKLSNDRSAVIQARVVLSGGCNYLGATSSTVENFKQIAVISFLILSFLHLPLSRKSSASRVTRYRVYPVHKCTNSGPHAMNIATS